MNNLRFSFYHIKQIVWDPDKKRWVNTEGDDIGEEAFKPPPKMADLMPAPAAPPQMPAAPVAAHIPSVQPPAATGYPSEQIPTGGNYGPAPSLNAGPSQTPIPQATQPTVSNNLGGPAVSTAAAPAGPTKVPTLQSNMFKMQRNRSKLLMGLQQIRIIKTFFVLKQR